MREIIPSSKGIRSVIPRDDDRRAPLEVEAPLHGAFSLRSGALPSFPPESLSPTPLQPTHTKAHLALGLGALALFVGVRVLASSPELPEAPAAELAIAASVVRTAPNEATPAAYGSPRAEAPAPSAAPSPVATAVAPPAGEALGPAEGALVVTSANLASVYVNGKLVGDTNTPVRALCGLKNVRLAQRVDVPPREPQWLGVGFPVRVACGSTTTVQR